MTIRSHLEKEWDFIPKVKENIFNDPEMKLNIKKFKEKSQKNHRKITEKLQRNHKEISSILKIDYKKNLSTFSNILKREMIINAVDPEDKIQ